MIGYLSHIWYSSDHPTLRITSPDKISAEKQAWKFVQSSIIIIIIIIIIMSLI